MKPGIPLFPHPNMSCSISSVVAPKSDVLVLLCLTAEVEVHNFILSPFRDRRVFAYHAYVRSMAASNTGDHCRSMKAGNVPYKGDPSDLS